MATITTISREELQRRLGEVQLVEALPSMYFRKAHLPGAVNIPPDQVDELAPKLLPDHDAAVVVYCQDFECQASTKVAHRLIELGYSDVADYEGGKEDWMEAGLDTERGITGSSAEPADGKRRRQDG